MTLVCVSSSYPLTILSTSLALSLHSASAHKTLAIPTLTLCMNLQYALCLSAIQFMSLTLMAPLSATRLCAHSSAWSFSVLCLSGGYALLDHIVSGMALDPYSFRSVWPSRKYRIPGYVPQVPVCLEAPWFLHRLTANFPPCLLLSDSLPGSAA